MRGGCIRDPQGTKTRLTTGHRQFTQVKWPSETIVMVSDTGCALGWGLDSFKPCISSIICHIKVLIRVPWCWKPTPLNLRWSWWTRILPCFSLGLVCLFMTICFYSSCVSWDADVTGTRRGTQASLPTLSLPYPPQPSPLHPHLSLPISA